jgi:hypothetical protein
MPSHPMKQSLHFDQPVFGESFNDPKKTRRTAGMGAFLGLDLAGMTWGASRTTFREVLLIQVFSGPTSILADAQRFSDIGIKRDNPTAGKRKERKVC